MQINSTEAAGLIAFLPAALVASAAAVAVRRASVRSGWALIGGVHALLSIEVLASMRHRLGVTIREWLRIGHLYPERRPVQAGLVLIILVLFLIAALSLILRAPTPRLAAATGATMAALAIFMVETVSLHAVDGLVYTPAGPILLIGWLWLACGSVTTAAALSAARRSREQPRG